MTLVMIFLAFLLAVTLTWVAARGVKADVRTPEQLLALAIHIDIAGFRNLVNPSEDAYLVTMLSSRELVKVVRARRRAALAYIASVAHNAALLLRLSEAARTSSDPSVATAAQHLADSAIEMRLHCVLLQVRLRVAILIPALPLPASAIADRYQKFTDSVLQFVGLENPAYLSRVSAAL